MAEIIKVDLQANGITGNFMVIARVDEEKVVYVLRYTPIVTMSEE